MSRLIPFSSLGYRPWRRMTMRLSRWRQWRSSSTLPPPTTRRMSGCHLPCGSKRLKTNRPRPNHHLRVHQYLVVPPGKIGSIHVTYVIRHSSVRRSSRDISELIQTNDHSSVKLAIKNLNETIISNRTRQNIQKLKTTSASSASIEQIEKIR